MRKLTILAGLALMSIALCFVSCKKDNPEEENGNGQQPEEIFVSKDIQKKVALIEEFTGINCGYCPDGHKRVQQILSNNPGKALAINEHAGSYAVTRGGVTYRTSFGDAYANQSGLDGYPAGTVNRHVFSGGVTALDRGSFASRANQIMNQDAPVNIAARATIEGRKLTVKVQAYYTANSNATSNYINVALLQDDVVGYQANGGYYNPDQGTDNAYHHMHMLRHMITDTWGDEVTTTTEGTLVKRTYTYDIPEVITTVPAVLENLKVICFICESHQEVINCCEAKITLL